MPTEETKEGAQVTNPTPAPVERYLGDGLYATFDGYQIILHTEREEGRHYVGLEPVVLEALIRFAEKVYNAKITIELQKE